MFCRCLFGTCLFLLPAGCLCALCRRLFGSCLFLLPAGCLRALYCRLFGAYLFLLPAGRLCALCFPAADFFRFPEPGCLCTEFFRLLLVLLFLRKVM